MGVVAVETRVDRELAAVFEKVLADIDLREVGRAGIETAVAELAQLAVAADRHLGQHLSLFEIGVEGDRAVAQLARHRGVDSLQMVGILDVVAHRARLVAAVSNLLVPVFGDRSATVRPELAPGIRDEK